MILFKHTKAPSLLAQIDQAEKGEIDRIVDHAMARYQALYPEYDMVYLALPQKGNPQRQAEVDKLMEMLRRHPLD